jgi:hypothetical protein
MFLYIISVSNIFSTNLLTNCQYDIPLKFYLHNMSTIKILFIVLDAIGIISFSIMLLLTVYYYIRKNKIAKFIL